MAVSVADLAIEEGALAGCGAQCGGDGVRHIVIDIDAAGGERHRQLPGGGIMLEMPDHGRGHNEETPWQTGGFAASDHGGKDGVAPASAYMRLSSVWRPRL